ncbi:MAG: twitching motility protein PilT [Cellulosilyticaceae bacterium]
MIQIITGQTGEGKTKQMIALANEQSKLINGHIIYVDSTTQHRLDLSHHIRLIEANTFPINPHDFFGFLCGILSSNHDIELIFIDEIIKITHLGIDELSSLIEKLNYLSETYDVNFIIGASCSKHQVPKHLLSYLVA